MNRAPDDLPRSPTGRIPQWVRDEAAGRVVDPSSWRAGGPSFASRPVVPHRPRRRALATTATLLVGAGVVGAWLTSATWMPPGGPGALLPPGSGIGQALGWGTPEPSADAVALADAAHLSEKGRRLFYDARPEVLGADQFAGRCTEPLGGPDDAVGCYRGDTGSIVVYLPADPRLLGSAVETAAHETLHAAWDRLPPWDRATLARTLEDEVARLPADDALHAQVERSVRGRSENRPTELFAYVGTQVWREGGLDPELEEVYGRFVADRAALVAVHTRSVAVLDTLRAEVEVASQQVLALESVVAQARTRLAADTAQAEAARAEYERVAARHAAMPAEQRARARLSWVWWEGSELPPAPAEETLAAVARLVARDASALRSSEASIVEMEADTAAERSRVEALHADLTGLYAQLDPAGGR
ncbi:hypothetical protein [Cellulomonas cellasea]|uniref:Uncharacterized protein n=1 Tax=Cellulomonas cellasea TaxID=43670 RepID=A0A7W4YD92_9CELL|nr:hypothetical protein [Cellulomonas cellasea]MBB2924296.1 hypothetical protein [Cellulomonas cellasea]